MNLNLEPREITLILNVLQEQPYDRVAALIRKIVHQTHGGNPPPGNCRECGRACTAWHYRGKGCIHAAEIAAKHNQ